MRKNLYYALAIFFFLISLTSILVLLISFFKLLPSDVIENRSKYQVDTQIIDHLGSGFGGMVGSSLALVSIILVLITMEQQKHDYQNQEIENRFFSLLHLFSENINKYTYLQSNGYQVFSIILTDYFKIFQEVKKGIESKKTLRDKLALKGKGFEVDIGEAKNQKSTFLFDDLVYEMTYILLLFGNENSVKNIIDYRLKKRFPPDLFINHREVDGYVSLYAELKAQDSLNEIMQNKSHILDNYFQSLYSIVNYLDKLPTRIVGKKKLELAEILQSKLSKEEQILLYLYSLTSFGTRFKEVSSVTNSKRGLGCMISKYNLIANILDSDFLKGNKIDPKYHYPRVKFSLEY